MHTGHIYIHMYMENLPNNHYPDFIDHSAMKVDILSKKLIKPSIPTPDELRSFNISFLDEMSPASNTPLILYYDPQPKSNSSCNGEGEGECNKIKGISSELLHSKLESSLAHVLPKFYPLAGRYIKECRLIDCGDQGIEYIQGQVDCPLVKILGSEMNTHQLNQFLSRSFGEADEFTDPIVSIKVSVFECGGVAIGTSFAHRIADISTVTTFLKAWADACFGSESIISPYFNSSALFPGKNIPKLEMGISRNSAIDTNVITSVFVFDGEAISSIKSKIANTDRPLTRVRTVSGLILKALLGVDRAKQGRSRPVLVMQTVNFREKTSPPFPPHSCGNLCVFAKAKFSAEQIEQTVELKNSTDLIQQVLKETIENCRKFLNSGEEGHMLMINPFKEVTETLYNNSDGELNVILFNSWCRSAYYEIDFGWGKPDWVSMVDVPFSNSVVLLDTKEGNGIEVWVSLDVDGMSVFRKDTDILRFAFEK